MTFFYYFRYYKEFLESSFYRKYQIDMLTSNRLHLIDILYNESIMFYFMEVCDKCSVYVTVSKLKVVRLFACLLIDSRCFGRPDKTLFSFICSCMIVKIHVGRTCISPNTRIVSQQALLLFGSYMFLHFILKELVHSSSLYMQ